jgi:hypothetical protein
MPATTDAEQVQEPCFLRLRLRLLAAGVNQPKASVTHGNFSFEFSATVPRCSACSHDLTIFREMRFLRSYSRASKDYKNSGLAHVSHSPLFRTHSDILFTDWAPQF